MSGFTRLFVFLTLILGSAVVFPSQTEAQTVEPGWYPYVVAREADRARIQSLPYHLRPYRPLHFYGNAVRRNHYRGSVVALNPRGAGAAVARRLIRR